jgi:serine/threonine protein kinase
MSDEHSILPEESVADWVKGAGKLNDAVRQSTFVEQLARNSLKRTKFNSVTGELNPVESGGSVQIGDYQLLEPIGRGGAAVVYRAYDLKLQRAVAIKIPKRNKGFDPTQFVQEARAAASIEHQHVVTIHAVEEGADYGPFIVMQLAEGGSLRHQIDNHIELVFSESADMVIQAGRGLAAAHELGVIHGDIKPGNILIDRQLEKVLLADFGLARKLKLSGERVGVAGTIGYMSPEQLCGEPATPRSDVFSLGATLYHLLTGVPPFTGTQEIARQKTLEGRIELPRTQNPYVPKDLETICMKALEHAADGRYPSVQRMVEDLEKWQKGEAISARPIGLFEKAFRFTRKHYIPVSLGGLVVVLLTAFLVGAILSKESLRRSEANERATRIVAENSLREANSLRDTSVELLFFCINPEPEDLEKTTSEKWLGRKLEILEGISRRKSEPVVDVAIAYVLQKRAEVYHDRQQLQKGIDDLQKATELLDDIETSHLSKYVDLVMIQCCNDLGQYCLEAKQKNLSELFYRRSISRFESIQDEPSVHLERMKLKAEIGLLGVFAWQGNREKARRSFPAVAKNTNAYLEKCPDDVAFRSTIASCYALAGMDLCHANQPEESIRYFEEALLHWHKLHNQRALSARAKAEFNKYYAVLQLNLEKSKEFSSTLRRYKELLDIINRADRGQ